MANATFEQALAIALRECAALPIWDPLRRKLEPILLEVESCASRPAKLALLERPKAVRRSDYVEKRTGELSTPRQQAARGSW